MRAALLTVLVTLIVTPPLLAEVAAISFEDLTTNSDVIVIAKVVSVSKSLFGNRYAKAHVIECWKGAQTNTVEFLASPTWTCDISEAKEGERILLFAVRGNKSRSYAIAHSGRGRMPLRDVNGKLYATFWQDAVMPEDTPTIGGPDPKWEFIRSVEISTLRDLVKKALSKKE